MDLGVNGTADVPADSPGWWCYPISSTWPYTVGTTRYRVDAADVIALPDIPQVDITLSPTETARVAAADVISLPDITWLTLEPRQSGAAIRVDQNNTREGALTFASTGTAPLFHTSGAPVLADDIKQTTLGDCYLQAVMMAIARNDPNYVPADDASDRRVPSRCAFTSRPGVPRRPSYIKVDKTLPQSATGTPLYNAGAIWARLIQKAFAVFAGMFGTYGGAYSTPRTLGGYADIAGGVERKVYGVFYGPALAAASASTVNYDPSASDATNLLASVDVIKALVEYQGQRPVAGAAGADPDGRRNPDRSPQAAAERAHAGPPANRVRHAQRPAREHRSAVAASARRRTHAPGPHAAPDQPRVRAVINLARTIAEGNRAPSVWRAPIQTCNVSNVDRTAE